ncbi:MAG: MMPL family transporter [Actinomycetota bacterium]|nr:MMPL family transporter [Actinomycetota bacterium]
MFQRLGKGVVGHPWRVIGLWVLAAAAIIGLAPKLSTTTNEASFLPSSYQSVQAQDLQRTAFPNAATPAALVVVERADGRPLTAADSASVHALAAKLASDHIPTLSVIQTGAPSANGLVQAIAVQMPNAQGQLSAAQTDAIGTLRTDVATAVAGTDLRAGVTGSAAQSVDQQQAGKKANSIVAVATIALILVLLLLIFRSPIVALLPVIILAIVSQMATGLIASASQAFHLNVDSTVTAMLIVVLFGVGTDYVLFLLFRYRERLRSGEPSDIAMINAISRVGPAIATAAGAVIIAFLALTLSSLSLFRSLGPALAIAVATTLFAGLTLVPAVVSLIGTRVFWPSNAWQTEPSGAHFATLGGALGRHPARFALASGGLLVALAVAAIGFHPTFDLNSGSSTTSQSTVYNAVLLKGFPAGATEPTDVYLASTDGRAVTTGALDAYRQRLASVHGVADVASPRLAEGGTVADFRVVLAAPGQSNAAMATVRGPLQQAADTAPTGTRPLIGGITSVYVDLQVAMSHDYAIVFPVAAVLILVILALLLQSVVAPWYLLGVVGLGFAATLGAAVSVFQYIGGSSGLTFILPIVMYLFVVALGTDYNILMVSRLREEANEGLDPRAAAAMALRHAGPTIASAGLILAGTFASLMLAGGSTLVQMGFAISIGIAIAAFVMAMFLTPALTALIGHRAWWPGHQPGSPATPNAAEEPALVGAGTTHRTP